MGVCTCIKYTTVKVVIYTLNGVYKLAGTNDKVSVQVNGSKTTVTIDMTGTQGQTVQFTLTK